jgi:hypothetical protein
MSSSPPIDAIDVPLNLAALVINGTVTIPYPHGRVLDDYLDAGHQVYAPAHQKVYNQGVDFSLAFGTSSVVLTWLNARPIPILSVLKVSLARVVYVGLQATNTDAAVTELATTQQVNSTDKFATPLRDWTGREFHMLDYFPRDVQRAIKARQYADAAQLKPWVQKAFNEAAVGCKLITHPGDYHINGTVTMGQQMDIEGRGARLIGDFGADASSNLLEIKIQSAIAGAGDVRLTKIEGLRAYFASGGYSVIHIENQSPQASNLQTIIERCGLGANDTGGGAAIRMKGLVTQIHRIVHCDITNSIWFDGCADSCSVHHSLIGGIKTGIRCDLADGAFRTNIEANTIVCRDGAIDVQNGSEIDIIDNQIEQMAADNLSSFASLIQLYPQVRAIKRVRIIGNNLGGGTHCSGNISMHGGAATVDDTFIDQNTFCVTASSYDVRQLSAGVRFTRMGPNNTVRGNRDSVTIDGSGVATANSLDERPSVYDLGVGTMGVRKLAADVTLANGWTASTDFSVEKSLDGTLTFCGNIISGTTTVGTTVMTLPAGFRPAVARYVYGISDATTHALMYAHTDGTITTVAGSGNIWLSGFQVPLRTTYDPGS